MFNLNIFTNCDAQQVISFDTDLDQALNSLVDYNEGSGEVLIQLFALKVLLTELKSCRKEIKELRSILKRG